ncbi:TPA: hypothetical protein DF272_01115 [Candidatus Falkowbacteria bacterium]|nr:hypothetical protein [Candidatus Falkowbacteria bacterium]
MAKNDTTTATPAEKKTRTRKHETFEALYAHREARATAAEKKTLNANARQIEAAAETPLQRLKGLDARLGKGKGAEAERQLMVKYISDGNGNVPLVDLRATTRDKAFASEEGLSPIEALKQRMNAAKTAQSSAA